MIDLRKERTPSQEMLKLISLSGLTQQQIADKVGVREASVSDYKTGKTAITVKTLKKWCEILEIDIKYLF
jgi:transcriptional regulator with XRE-family HTH domain